jgi:hypothetical protein
MEVFLAELRREIRRRVKWRARVPVRSAPSEPSPAIAPSR